MKKIVLLLAVCSLTMTSCIIPQKVVYMKDIKPGVGYPISPRPEMKIQKDDRLKITVASSNPDLTVPYNLRIGEYHITPNAQLQTTVSSTPEQGYLVNSEGYIEFPEMGKIYVEGLTLRELSDLIKEYLRKGGKVFDAIVTVTFLNFKIFIMGEVGSGGFAGGASLAVPEGRITLFEAIMLAGGVTSNASMKDVEVTRDFGNGQMVMMKVDIRKMGLFTSPAFHLQQNDMVYVRPRVPQQTAREARGWQLVSVVLNITSIITSIFILGKVFK